MKTTFIYTFLVSILLISFSACNGDKTTKEDSKSGDTPIIDSPASLERFRIDKIPAKVALVKYKAYADSAQANLKRMYPERYSNVRNKLNYGVKVDLKELRRLTATAEFVNADELYLMNAIRSSGDSTSEGPVEDVNEIIFVLKSAELDKNGDPEWYYFDFTQPCPAACPKELGIYPIE
jgi:hypothetical protein